MKELYSEIQIKASASTVWNILTDFDDFMRWNPFIKEISGNLKVGSQISVCIKPPNSNAMKFKPKLLKYDPEKEIRWIGKFYLPKLVDGEHSLSIKKLDDENVLFVQKEKFSGLLVPFISGLLKDTKKGFELMNNELKKEAEQKDM
jgi:hypothetical protein